MTKFQELAAEFAASFETLTREDGTQYVTGVADRPRWMDAAIYAAHNGEMPNDWRYRLCESIVSAIVDEECESADDIDSYGELADSLVDVYTSDLLAWLSGNMGRTSYVDEALEDDCWEKSSGFAGLLAAAQYLCIERMVSIIVDAISWQVDV